MLSERLDAALRRYHAIGAVAGTLHKGAREYAAAGSARPGMAMAVGTPVRIASIGKPMVALAVYHAFPGELDVPLVELLPDLRDGWRLHEGVTLRRLLSHTAGLADTDADTLSAYGEGDDALDAAVRRESSQRNRWRPGTAWAYCNAGFRFAGAALAHRHGATFEDAMRDLVFTPAGMRDTGFETPDGSAVGHRRGVPQPLNYVRARRPGGGLWSTTKDVLSFAEYVLADRAYADEARKVLSPAAFGHRYGLGWFLSRDGVLFHFGDVAGFQGLLAIAADHATASVAVGNDEHGGRLSRVVALGEITRHTGIPRRRMNLVRVGHAAARLGLARLKGVTGWRG